jgi:chromosome segregation ATPase
MSGTAKSTKAKATQPAVVPFVLAAAQNLPVQNLPVQNLPVQNSPVQNPPLQDPPVENPSVDTPVPTEKTASVPAAVKTSPISFEGVAILALGEAGEILAARDACVEVFGWEPPALVSQNIRVLLKGGLDNDVGRFLHRHRAGKNPMGTIALRVWGIRKDGSEFPAQVTTLTWNWGTAVTTKGDISRLCWTAAFRDLSATKSAQQAGNDVEPSCEVTSEIRDLDHSESASAPSMPSLLQEQNDSANGQVAEQVAGYELKQRIKELEDQLTKATHELAGTKAGAEKMGCHGSELQAQLAAAKEAAGYAEAALRDQTAQREKLEERLQTLSNNLRLEQAERSKRFEEELVSLRQERDELNSRLAAEQQGAGESTRRAEELEAFLKRNAAELERAKADLEKQTSERQQSESSWREQLDTVWIAKKEVEGAWAGAVERNKQIEEELAKLRREHDELNRNLATEQKAAAESKERAREFASRLSRNAADSDRARAGLEKENEKRERADAEWRKQLDAAKTLKTQLESSLAEATERSKRFEEELAKLRQERDELQNQAKGKQNAAAGSVQRTDELQRRLDQRTAELERLTADLEEERAERERAETRSREQHEAAKKLEADWAGAVERNVCFEEELVELRRNRDELAVQLKSEQQIAAEAAHRAEELERRLERNTTEIQRASMEAEKQRSERDSADSDWREQLETAKALARKLDAAWTAATERSRRLEEDVTGLRQEREELLSQLASAQREAAALRARIDDFETKVHRPTIETERQTAEPAKPVTERVRSDSHRRSQTDVKALRLRHDLNQQNGNGIPKPGASTTVRSSLPSMAAVHPVQKVTEPEPTQTEPDQATTRHPGQVIQQYSFDHPTSKPVRREAPSPKKRHQP